EFAVFALTKEAKRLAGLVKSGIDAKKNETMIKVLLRKIDEFLSCYRSIYGDEAANNLIRIIEENTNGI
ncbi:MAG: hypothetical protein PUB48_08940, partial [Solobacterium sp.]|nr:hypothetical protein [Solobacterium sp.]